MYRQAMKWICEGGQFADYSKIKIRTCLLQQPARYFTNLQQHLTEHPEHHYLFAMAEEA